MGVQRGICFCNNQHYIATERSIWGKEAAEPYSMNSDTSAPEEATRLTALLAAEEQQARR